MAAALDELGIPGSFEGARQFAANPQMISRTHFARFLVHQGTVKDMNGAFRRFLGGGQPAFVSHGWASLSDAVSWINGSGGFAVIAHPGRYALDTAQLRALFAEFREFGGSAIEVVSGSHKPPASFAAHARGNSDSQHRWVPTSSRKKVITTSEACPRCLMSAPRYGKNWAFKVKRRVDFTRAGARLQAMT
jgi:predicted metal-dependent phosphoesterase TrpH